MDDLIEILKTYDVKRIEVNGDHYEFNYNNLHVELDLTMACRCTGTIKGQAYDKTLLSDGIEGVKLEIDKTRDREEHKWKGLRKKNNYREINVFGVIDEIFPALIEMMDTSIEEYVEKSYLDLLEKKLRDREEFLRRKERDR